MSLPLCGSRPSTSKALSNPYTNPEYTDDSRSLGRRFTLGRLTSKIRRRNRLPLFKDAQGLEDCPSAESSYRTSRSSTSSGATAPNDSESVESRSLDNWERSTFSSSQRASSLSRVESLLVTNQHRPTPNQTVIPLPLGDHSASSPKYRSTQTTSELIAEASTLQFNDLFVNNRSDTLQLGAEPAAGPSKTRETDPSAQTGVHYTPDILRDVSPVEGCSEGRSEGQVYGHTSSRFPRRRVRLTELIEDMFVLSGNDPGQFPSTPSTKVPEDPMFEESALGDWPLGGSSRNESLPGHLELKGSVDATVEGPMLDESSPSVSPAPSVTDNAVPILPMTSTTTLQSAPSAPHSETPMPDIELDDHQLDRIYAAAREWGRSIPHYHADNPSDTSGTPNDHSQHSRGYSLGPFSPHMWYDRFKTRRRRYTRLWSGSWPTAGSPSQTPLPDLAMDTAVDTTLDWCDAPRTSNGSLEYIPDWVYTTTQPTDRSWYKRGWDLVDSLQLHRYRLRR